jgi:hypothetical protein
MAFNGTTLLTLKERGTRLLDRWVQDEGTGAGVYDRGMGQRFVFSLGRYFAVLQPEV